MSNQIHTIITDQAECRKVLAKAGFMDLAAQIVGEGYAFTPVMGDTWFGMAAAQKRPGKVEYRIYCVDQKHGDEAALKVFASLMEQAAEHENSPLRLQLWDIGGN